MQQSYAVQEVCRPEMSLLARQMAHIRLKHFIWFSVAGHLTALVCGSFFVRNMELRLAPPETVCFVNLNQPPARALNSTGKSGTMIRTRAAPGPPAPVAIRTPKETAPTPLRQPAEKSVAQVAERSVAQTVTPPATGVPTVSPGAGTSGATTTKAASGAGGTGVANNSPHESGDSQGGVRGGQPGEVGFGTATGISYAHQVKPVYPTLARRFNREGRVLLRLTVSETGALVNVEVIEDPGYGFASAAVDAVRKSRYNPARLEGRPFSAQAFLPVRFTLSSGE